MADSPYPLCDHIKDNGERCGSPARRGEKLCHFHGRASEPTKLPGKPGYRLAVIECAESIQITVAHVNQALLDGTIDAKTANTIFRGLGLVKSVLPNLPNRSSHRPTSSASAAPETYQGTTSFVPSDASLPSGLQPPSIERAARPPKKRPLLSAPELAGIRKIIRQGPKHPDFARATRIFDTYIASRSTA